MILGDERDCRAELATRTDRDWPPDSDNCVGPDIGASADPEPDARPCGTGRTLNPSVLTQRDVVTEMDPVY